MSFHVPEKYRIRIGRLASDKSFGNNGAFAIPPVVASREMFVIASDGAGWEDAGFSGEPWEHVSVHCEDSQPRTPTWTEMCAIKDLFWDSEDVVMQIHPKKSEYVNNHAHTLHLWRPTIAPIPTPPSLTVGVKELGELKYP